MASPYSSAPSSPIRFDVDSPCADWAPAPLRIPCRKGKGDSEDANSICLVEADYEQTFPDQQVLTIRKNHINIPPDPMVSPDTRHRRTTASRLGPLVSKFEILDAVNNADTRNVTRIRSHTVPSLTRTEAKTMDPKVFRVNPFTPASRSIKHATPEKPPSPNWFRSCITSLPDSSDSNDDVTAPHPATPRGHLATKKASVADLRHSFEAASTEPRPEIIKPAPVTPQNAHKTPVPTSSRSRQRRPTRVSDLRRLFDRSKGSSSPPVVSSEPPLAFKRLLAPELTTVISTNDFTCDFNSPKKKKKAETESPLKQRIQQFEKLKTEPRTVPAGRAKSYDANLHSSFEDARGIGDPTHGADSHSTMQRRGTQWWRRVSNPLTESLDGARLFNRSSSNHAICSTGSIGGSVFGVQLFRPSSPVHSIAITPRHNSKRSRSSSVDINQSITATLETSPPFLLYSRSPVQALSPKGRKRQHALTPFSTTIDTAGSATPKFGIDGNRSSKDLGIHSQETSGNADPKPLGNRKFNHGSTNLTIHGNSSVMTMYGLPRIKQTTALPTAEQLSRRLERETRKASRQQEREARRTARELARQAAREAKEAKRKGKQKEPASEAPLGVTAAAEAVVQGKERSWNKITASGFMVREAGIDLQEPKPFRPGQVKKIVNMYKEKSSSFLRVVSGSHKDGHGHGLGGGGDAGVGATTAEKREPKGKNRADEKGARWRNKTDEKDAKGKKKPMVGKCGGAGC